MTKKSTDNKLISSRRRFLTNMSVGAGGAAVASLAAPALAQSRIELTMVTPWPRDFPGIGTGAQQFAKDLTDMTDGRFQVQYYASGERVKAFDTFDEVASGNAHIYHAVEFYWKGKHPAYSYFGSVPFGMTANESAAWIRWMGGQELWDELAGEFGVKCFMGGNSGVQMGGWYKKEINSADDFKGLKVRMPGLGGDVIAKLGGSPISLPGSQIYEALVSGTIDGTEFIGPWNDNFLKFYEAAKFYYYPGMHEPGTITSIGMNKEWWDSLQRSDQLILEAACSKLHMDQYTEYNAKNGEWLDKLVKEQGVKLREFPDDVADAFGAAAQEVFEEIREHSDLARRIDDSYRISMKSTGTWLSIADQAYSVQRNRVLGI